MYVIFILFWDKKIIIDTRTNHEAHGGQNQYYRNESKTEH